jgi:hypothetical protein
MSNYELSDRKLKVLIVLAFVLIGWLCFKGAALSHAQSAPAGSQPGLQEIVRLTKAHMTDDVILAYIKNSGLSYKLSADDVLYLNGQGVSQPVISALLQSTPAPAPVPTAAAPPQISPQPVPPQAPPPVAPQAPAPVPVTAPPPVLEGSAGPLAGSEVTLPYFQTQLAPYGSWIDVPGYGLCWKPSVEATVPDWRPYFNDGHWDYTDDGWYWRSEYPWGDYVFHYGRWARDLRYGWVWVPGYHWGPAWVCWRNAGAEGFCGWAPLPPGARFEVGVGLLWNGRVAVDADFGLGADLFVFVPFDRFWEHDYRAFAAPGWRAAALFHRSVLANSFRFASGHFVMEGIGRERIGLLTHREVPVARLEFRDARIARERDIQHNRSMEVQRSRGSAGRDERHDADHRGF